MLVFRFEDIEHIKRERRKAQELRKSSWWKQQLGPGICSHCSQKFSKEKLTMDHLTPIARGGKSTKSNCVVSCKECNTKKGHFMDVELTMQEMQESREMRDNEIMKLGSDSDHPSDRRSGPQAD